MQRPDRINFPQVASEVLWEEISSDTPSSFDGSNPFTNPSENGKFFRTLHTPLISSPRSAERISSPQVPQYFRDREYNDLVTPARTPSDILRRGPLYDSTVSEAETEPTSAYAFPEARVDFLKHQIEYHRERCVSISSFIKQFLVKMNEIQSWHKDQECKYQDELSARIKPNPLDIIPSTTVDYTLSTLCIYD